MLAIKNVRRYIGIPYKHHGRTPEGMDCYGLAKEIYKNELGIDVPDFEYDQRVANEAFDAIHSPSGAWMRSSTESLQPFDIMVFRNFGVVGQVAIYIGDNKAIFTGSKAGSCLRPLSAERMNRCIGVYRWAG
jgi:cell wall-associated NlpC family hydrolase